MGTRSRSGGRKLSSFGNARASGARGLAPRCDRAVAADAANLPFADHVFAAIIAKHSLEHVDRLPEVPREMGRVLTPGGCVFVTVPDASTLTDKIYRWLATSPPRQVHRAARIEPCILDSRFSTG